MLRFDLRQLRQFVAVAESGSFRVAAEQLFITQPALSVSVRKLEEALGVVLLIRRHRGVVVTEAGRALLPQFKRTLAHAERSQREAALVSRGELGSVRVGFVGSAVYRLLPAVLPAFRRDHPNVRLELIEGTTASFLDKVRGGELDVAFLRQPLLDAAGLRVFDVERDHLIAVLPRNHPLASRAMLDLHELSQEPFICFSRVAVPGLNTAVMAACRDAGFEPHVAQDVTQATTMIGLVGSGLGVGLVPAVISEIAGPKVAFVPLKQAIPQSPLILSMVALEEAPAVATDLFWNHLVQQMRGD